jgi:hypothetical protein
MLSPSKREFDEYKSLGWMQVMMVQYQQKLHSLQVHTRFFKTIQMDNVVTFLKYYYSNI